MYEAFCSPSCLPNSSTLGGRALGFSFCRFPSGERLKRCFVSFCPDLVIQRLSPAAERPVGGLGSPDASALQQLSATASWSFANHSGSLLDAAGRVRAWLAARSATRSGLEARDAGEPRDAVHAVYMTYDHSRRR